MQKFLAPGSILVAAAILLAACAPASTPVKAVEDYLGALAGKDSTTISLVTCPDWTESALMEMNSLQAVETSLENLACEESGTEGDLTLVTCEGRIVLNYNGELQGIDLSLRTYQVIEQGGEYLVCNYR